MVEYDVEQVRFDPVENVQELRACLANPKMCWVDVQGLGDEAKLRELADVFGLGPLVLEDAVNFPQRAKSEVYENYHLIVARAPQILDDGNLAMRQVCFVVGDNWLLTIQESYFGFFEPVRERIRAGLGLMRQRGADYLTYAMLDTLVDWYVPVTEQIVERLDELEAWLANDPDNTFLTEIHSIRGRIVDLRRVGRPQRTMVASLLTEPSKYFGPEIHVFLRDTDDHISQIMETVESTRETTAHLAEGYLAQVGFRSNEIMKVLTLMASLFIPLTFIAGVYGMNFQNMPELQNPNAYYLVLGIMVVVAIGMLAYFHHRGWISLRRGRRPRD